MYVTCCTSFVNTYALQEDQPDAPEAYQYHVGKDYGNTFIKGAPDPDKPFEG